MLEYGILKTKKNYYQIIVDNVIFSEFFGEDENELSLSEILNLVGKDGWVVNCVLRDNQENSGLARTFVVSRPCN